MKKYLIGLLSIALVLASIFGGQAKTTRDRGSRRGDGPAMWV